MCYDLMSNPDVKLLPGKVLVEQQRVIDCSLVLFRLTNVDVYLPPLFNVEIIEGLS